MPLWIVILVATLLGIVTLLFKRFVWKREPLDSADRLLELPVFYINLSDRNDRREEVVTELCRVFKPNSVNRIDAIRRANGAEGCRESHIKALNAAEACGEHIVLIAEDDLMWKHSAQMTLDHLADNLADPSWNVLLLACHVPHDAEHSVDCLSTVAYIIKKNYIKTLRGLWENEASLRSSLPIDQSWRELQRKGGFKKTDPLLVTQRPSHSDIEGAFADHRHIF